MPAYLIFFGSYFVFALGKFPWMKIDRPGAAMIGAVLVVAFRSVGPQEALQSIDFPTIVLLFSMMLVVNCCSSCSALQTGSSHWTSGAAAEARTAPHSGSQGQPRLQGPQ